MLNTTIKQRLWLALFLSSMGTVTVVQAQTPERNELFTPTLWVQAPDVFACNLTNVSSETRTVRVRIISDGDLLNDSGSVAVQPRHTANYTFNGPPNGGPIYCEFNVEGSRAWYRGAAKAFHSGPISTDVVAIAAQ
jgi:hypothetical protein